MRRADGQILPGLMMLLLAIVGIGVMVFGVGRASLLRSDAQTAADAAALAGARNVRDQLIRQIATRGYTNVAEINPIEVGGAARAYARRNDARLLRYTVALGDVRVWVETDDDMGRAGESTDTDDLRGDARARGRVVVSGYFGGLGGLPSIGGGGGGGAQGSWKGISDAEWKAFGKTISQPPKCSPDPDENDVTKLGRFLRSHGVSVIESKQMGDTPAPGAHSANGWHYKCDASGALDINTGPPGPGLTGPMNAIRPHLQELGFFTIWQAPDHYDHMHVDAQYGGGGGAGGGGGGGLGGFGGLLGGIEDTQLQFKLVDWDAPALSLAAALPGVAQAGGNPFGPPDPTVAAKICQALEETNAPPKARLALWEAAIVESGVHDLPDGHSSSVGVLQLLDIHLGGSVAARRDVVLVSKLFLQRGFTGRGGAIALSRNAGMSAGQVAQAVQGSAFPLRYDQRQSQALELDRRFCGGKG